MNLITICFFLQLRSVQWYVARYLLQPFSGTIDNRPVTGTSGRASIINYAVACVTGAKFFLTCKRFSLTFRDFENSGDMLIVLCMNC
jgi:hypothetical protein